VHQRRQTTTNDDENNIPIKALDGGTTAADEEAIAAVGA